MHFSGLEMTIITKVEFKNNLKREKIGYLGQLGGSLFICLLDLTTFILYIYQNLKFLYTHIMSILYLLQLLPLAT